MLYKTNKKIRLTLCCIVVISIFACRKDLSSLFETKLNPDTRWAVDYFNTVLQPKEGNQVSYKSLNKISSSEGIGKKPNMKTPMWLRARASKTAIYDFVETPLMYTRKISRSVIKTGEVANEAILKASFDRLVIYKNKKGRINQRIISYVPDAGYLSRHNGDISHNKIENLDKDFDGFLIYSAWDGTVLFRLRVDHGVARKLKNKFIPPQISLKTNKIANSDHTASRNTLSTVECYDLWEIEYEEHCYYDNPDDTVPRYCDPPIEISRTWVDTICPGDDGSIDCSDPANFETAECGGGDGGGEGCRGCDNEGGTSSEIINNVSDTCLNKAVDSIINNNVVGKIKEIINRLGDRSDVHIRIYDAPFTTNGYPGQTSGTYWTKDPVTNEITSFNTNIILSQDLLLTSSQEHIAAVLIHEILHAYFRENTGKAEQFEGLDHQTMVNDYINSIAEFLTSLYGISLTDATAIAWDGVSDTDAYKNTSNFTVGSGTNATTISKEDLQGINSNYVAKSNGKGKGLCQE